MDYNRTKKEKLIAMLKKALDDNARLAAAKSCTYLPADYKSVTDENKKLKQDIEDLKAVNEIITGANELFEKRYNEARKEVTELGLTIINMAKELHGE